MTRNELEQALGGAFQLNGDKEQARILDAGGFDIAYIDIVDGRIEHELCVKWHDQVDADALDATDRAQGAVDRELRSKWADAGFEVCNQGVMGEYWYAGADDKKLPVYKVKVSKHVSDVKGAVDTVGWIEDNTDELWL